jgi:hypothetical protein
VRDLLGELEALSAVLAPLVNWWSQVQASISHSWTYRYCDRKYLQRVPAGGSPMRIAVK